MESAISSERAVAESDRVSAVTISLTIEVEEVGGDTAEEVGGDTAEER